MALPSKRDPEPADRQAETDPFLEFEPERPSLFKAPPPGLPPISTRSVAPGPPTALGAPSPAVSVQIRPRSGVGAATLAIALFVAVAVAGVAMVAMWGDQIRQGFAALTRRAPTAGSSATAGRTPPSQAGLDATDPVTSVSVAPLAGPAPTTSPSPSSVTAPPPVSTPTTPVAAARGTVAFSSPLDLEVFHQGQLIGTTGAGALTLPAGVVDLVLVSSRHEFRQPRTVTVTSGQSVAAVVTLPNGRLSVNAEPWADVLIDNRPVGTTPLANLPVRIGSHEVVWRHPTLGERRQIVVVKAKTPTRVGIDFRR